MILFNAPYSVNVKANVVKVSPAIFRKLEKKALIWRKNGLIGIIYG